jgi:hypothetical protein
MVDAVFEVGRMIPCVRRSANALTCSRPISAGDAGPVFVKVAPIVDPRADSILSDAANSVIVRAMDPDSIWSVRIRGLDLCKLEKTNSRETCVETVNDDNARHVAMSFDVVSGSTLSSSRAPISAIMRGVRALLHNMIHYSSRTGMTHNDMHCGNTMINDTHELRVIDYGRMQFGHRTIQETEGLDDILSLDPMWDDETDVMSTWADPFQRYRATNTQHEHLYWIADLMTFSMNVFSMVARARRARGKETAHPAFLKKDTMFRANFRNADALKDGLDRMDPAFNVLKPGMALYAIVLKEYEEYRNRLKKPVPPGPISGLFWQNFTVEKNGGWMLQTLFNSEDGVLINKKKYGIILPSLFLRAGLWRVVAPVWGAPSMTGGSDRPPPIYDDDIDLEPSPLSRESIEHEFPCSLEEAALQKFRDRSSKHPNAQTVKAPEWHNAVHLGGGKRVAFQAVLAAVVVAASLLPR